MVSMIGAPRLLNREADAGANILAWRPRRPTADRLRDTHPHDPSAALPRRSDVTNVCRGIVVAVALSLPIWSLLGVLLWML